MAVAAFGLLLSLLALPSLPARAATITFRQVAAGSSTTCAVTSAGAAYCWGRNTNGTIGDGTTNASLVPVAVSGGYVFSSVSPGINQTCGVTTGNKIYCWGRNNTGNLGDGTYNDSSTPVLVSGAQIWASVSSGDSTTCAVTTAGVGYCWGWGWQGQIGDGNTTDRSIPRAVSGGYTWASITTGSKETCGVTTSNVGYCWGLNDAGQGGDGAGTSVQKNSPTLVAGGYSWASISANGRATCGITTANAAYCWGGGTYGQIGDGNTTAANRSPVAVSGGLSVLRITAGIDEMCALTTSSAIYCWGKNTNGGVGDSTTTQRNSPVNISGSTLYAFVSGGNGYACAVTTNDIVYCWGTNTYGQLGDGTTTNRSVPTSTYFSSDTTVIQAAVDPFVTFTITGRSSVCNGQSSTNFQTGATATAVTLGRVTATTVGGGAQDLTIATNSASGFIVYVRTTGTTPNPFRDGAGHVIADVPGTNAAPGSPPSAGTAGFGYTSSDTSTAFTSNKWAKLTSSNGSVLVGSGGTNSKSACVGYQVAIATTTPPGTYSTNVVYTAVPSF